MFLKEPSHILLILLVLVILFGAKRLPDSARSLARSMKIFRSEIKDIKQDENEAKNETNNEANNEGHNAEK